MGFAFQAKYWTYRYLCCQSQKFGKLLSSKDRHDFFHELEHLHDNLHTMNESLSLKATMKYNNVIQKKKDQLAKEVNTMTSCLSNALRQLIDKQMKDNQEAQNKD